jgi:hypothetical protein
MAASYLEPLPACRPDTGAAVGKGVTAGYLNSFLSYWQGARAAGGKEMAAGYLEQLPAFQLWGRG